MSVQCRSARLVAVAAGLFAVLCWRASLGAPVESAEPRVAMDLSRGWRFRQADGLSDVQSGAFDDSPATLILTANQARGPGVGHAVALAFTNAASTVPEPSTWAMMVLGFVGLGYAAFRRNSKARAIAV